jgi:ABC-type antimicrobial peptide transport system permease subunit
MLMAILERTREIGMLMALGMNKLRVFMMILLETTFLVLAGCPVGLLAAFATVKYTGVNGINLSIFSKAFQALGYSETVYPKLELRHYLIILILVCLTALFSALFPARKALRLKPSEAIRK